MLVGAAEEIILTMKDGRVSASDKHNEILSLLGHISPKQYSELSNLTSNLLEFSDNTNLAPAISADDLQTNASINVLFYESSGDEDGKSEQDMHEVREYRKY